MTKKVVITGGAGYIGSLLTGLLLHEGCQVIAIDKLLFGGDHMLGYFETHGSLFALAADDVMDISTKKLMTICANADAIIHLAGLVGFPACQQAGEAVVRRYNEDTAKRMYDIANDCDVPKFIFSSTYSNYGKSIGDKPVTEESPLNPQSLYAETKIATEEMFGLSLRTRFDLIINQFVLEAIKKGKLIIYQKDFRRSFVHVKDIVQCVADSALRWDLDKYNDIWNVGANKFNLSKEQVVALIKKHTPFEVEYKNLSFGGDMRDITVSFDKIEELFKPNYTVEAGIAQIKMAIEHRIVSDPFNDRYRNAKFIV